MRKNKPFTFQFIVLGGFIFFFYMFFALATSIYRDYNLESEIERFESEVNRLAEMAQKKPDDVAYYASREYKDRYAKESLNLLNPGEKLIIIPEENHIIEQGPATLKDDTFDHAQLLNKSNPIQWREYFFGRTLSVKSKEKKPVIQEENKKEPESIEERSS